MTTIYNLFHAMKRASDLAEKHKKASNYAWKLLKEVVGREDIDEFKADPFVDVVDTGMKNLTIQELTELVESLREVE